VEPRISGIPKLQIPGFYVKSITSLSEKGSMPPLDRVGFDGTRKGNFKPTPWEKTKFENIVHFIKIE